MASRSLTQTPEYQTALIERLYVVRWRVSPRAEHVDAVVREVSSCAKTTRELIYCGISDNNATVADPALAKRLVEGSAQLARIVSELHMVLVGDSMGAMLSRSAYRGMLAAGRVGNRVLGVSAEGLVDKFRIHETIDAFLERLDSGKRAREIREELQRLGLLDGL